MKKSFFNEENPSDMHLLLDEHCSTSLGQNALEALNYYKNILNDKSFKEFSHNLAREKYIFKDFRLNINVAIELFNRIKSYILDIGPTFKIFNQIIENNNKKISNPEYDKHNENIIEITVDDDFKKLIVNFDNILKEKNEYDSSIEELQNILTAMVDYSNKKLIEIMMLYDSSNNDIKKSTSDNKINIKKDDFINLFDTIYKIKLVRVFLSLKIKILKNLQTPMKYYYMGGVPGHAIGTFFDFRNKRIIITNSGLGITYHPNKGDDDVCLILDYQMKNYDSFINVIYYTILNKHSIFTKYKIDKVKTPRNIDVFYNIIKDNTDDAKLELYDEYYSKPQMSGSCTFYATYYFFKCKCLDFSIKGIRFDNIINKIIEIRIKKFKDYVLNTGPFEPIDKSIYELLVKKYPNHFNSNDGFLEKYEEKYEESLIKYLNRYKITDQSSIYAESHHIKMSDQLEYGQQEINKILGIFADFELNFKNYSIASPKNPVTRLDIKESMILVDIIVPEIEKKIKNFVLSESIEDNFSRLLNMFEAFEKIKNSINHEEPKNKYDKGFREALKKFTDKTILDIYIKTHNDFKIEYSMLAFYLLEFISSFRFFLSNFFYVVLLGIFCRYNTNNGNKLNFVLDDDPSEESVRYNKLVKYLNDGYIPISVFKKKDIYSDILKNISKYIKYIQKMNMYDFITINNKVFNQKIISRKCLKLWSNISIDVIPNLSDEYFYRSDKFKSINNRHSDNLGNELGNLFLNNRFYFIYYLFSCIDDQYFKNDPFDRHSTEIYFCNDTNKIYISAREGISDVSLPSSSINIQYGCGIDICKFNHLHAIELINKNKISEFNIFSDNMNIYDINICTFHLPYLYDDNNDIIIRKDYGNESLPLVNFNMNSYQDKIRDLFTNNFLFDNLNNALHKLNINALFYFFNLFVMFDIFDKLDLEKFLYALRNYNITHGFKDDKLKATKEYLLDLMLSTIDPEIKYPILSYARRSLFIEENVPYHSRKLMGEKLETYFYDLHTYVKNYLNEKIITSDNINYTYNVPESVIFYEYIKKIDKPDNTFKIYFEDNEYITYTNNILKFNNGTIVDSYNINMPSCYIDWIYNLPNAFLVKYISDGVEKYKILLFVTEIVTKKSSSFYYIYYENPSGKKKQLHFSDKKFHLIDIHYTGLYLMFTNFDQINDYFIMCRNAGKIDCIDRIIHQFYNFWLNNKNNKSDPFNISLNSPFVIKYLLTYLSDDDKVIFEIDKRIKYIPKKYLVKDLSNVKLSVNTNNIINKFTISSDFNNINRVVSNIDYYKNNITDDLEYFLSHTQACDHNYLIKMASDYKNKISKLENLCVSNISKAYYSYMFTDCYNYGYKEYIINKSDIYYQYIMKNTIKKIIYLVNKHEESKDDCNEYLRMFDFVNNQKLYLDNRDTTIVFFELISGMITWKNQVDVYKSILKEIDNGNSLTLQKYKHIYQLLMGQGKTSVITPLLVLNKLFFSNNTKNVIIVLPKELTNQTYEGIFIEKISPILDNIHLKTTEIGRYTCNKNDNTCINIFSTNKIMVRNLIVIDDTSLKALYMARNKEVTKNIIENYIIVFDEFDKLYRPSSSKLIYPKENKKIDHIDYVSYLITSYLKYFCKITNTYDFPDIDTSKKFHFDLFIKYLIKNEQNKKYGTLFSETLKYFYRSDRSKSKSAEFYKLQNLTLIIIDTIIKTFINKYNIHYGLVNNILPINKNISMIPKFFNTFLAIPYRGANSPIIGSKFNDYMITIITSVMSYFKNGLRENDIYQLHLYCKKLVPNNVSEQVTGAMFGYLIPIFKKYSYYSYNEDIISQETFMFPNNPNNNIRLDKNLIVFYLTKVVIPNVLDMTNTSESCSFLDICRNTFVINKTGFSGTVNIDKLLIDYDIGLPDYPEFKKIEYSPESNGAVECAMLGIINKVKVYCNMGNIYDFFRFITDNNYNCLIDSGAFFKNYSSKQFINKFRKYVRNNNIQKYINLNYIYIDNENKKNVCYQGNTSPYKEEVYDTDKIFIYYDNKHVVGIDIKQPYRMRGVATIDNFNDYTYVSQSIYRLRSLNYGHCIDFLVEKNIYDNGVKSAKDLVDYLHNNENSNIVAEKKILLFQNLKYMKENILKKYSDPVFVNQNYVSTYDSIDKYYYRDFINETFRIRDGGDPYDNNLNELLISYKYDIFKNEHMRINEIEQEQEQEQEHIIENEVKQEYVMTNSKVSKIDKKFNFNRRDKSEIRDIDYFNMIDFLQGTEQNVKSSVITKAIENGIYFSPGIFNLINEENYRSIEYDSHRNITEYRDYYTTISVFDIKPKMVEYNLRHFNFYFMYNKKLNKWMIILPEEYLFLSTSANRPDEIIFYDTYFMNGNDTIEDTNIKIILSFLTLKKLSFDEQLYILYKLNLGPGGIRELDHIYYFDFGYTIILPLFSFFLTVRRQKINFLDYVIENYNNKNFEKLSIPFDFLIESSDVDMYKVIKGIYQQFLINVGHLKNK